MVGLRWLALWLYLSRSYFMTLLARRITVRLTGAAIATGGLALIGVGTVGSPVLSNGIALQAAGGDSNGGDVWVDNVGQPAGPGHEQDPHLSCTNINLWGNSLADSSGTYTIDGWPGTGTGAGDLVYGVATWHYNTAAGGDQVISVINVQTLLADALANGDTLQAQQGLHFKLQLLQDPQKHKTFWVNCVPATTTTSSTTSSTASTTTSTSTATSTTSTAPGGATSTTSAAPGATTTTTPAALTTTVTSAGVGAGVLGASTSTPSTGADVEFGLGLGLMIGGAALAAGAGPLFRRLKK